MVLLGRKERGGKETMDKNLKWGGGGGGGSTVESMKGKKEREGNWTNKFYIFYMSSKEHLYQMTVNSDKQFLRSFFKCI